MFNNYPTLHPEGFWYYSVMDNVTHFYAKDRAAWRQWLDANHDKEAAVWLVYDKGAGRTMSWQDIVKEALCYGWIDSKPGKVSDTQGKIYISRRKPKSVWSKINKANIEYLQAEGLLMPAGIKAIEVAKANGSWDALNKADTLELPPELVAEFSRNRSAQAFFDSLSYSSKRNTLQWLYDAKTDSTISKRIGIIIDSCSRGVNPAR
jgi:uncharacterized protein YdeI (YjbR/CyaY-like superfamily)